MNAHIPPQLSVHVILSCTLPKHIDSFCDDLHTFWLFRFLYQFALKQCWVNSVEHHFFFLMRPVGSNLFHSYLRYLNIYIIASVLVNIRNCDIWGVWKCFYLHSFPKFPKWPSNLIVATWKTTHFILVNTVNCGVQFEFSSPKKSFSVKFSSLKFFVFFWVRAQVSYRMFGGQLTW